MNPYLVLQAALALYALLFGAAVYRKGTGNIRRVFLLFAISSVLLPVGDSGVTLFGGNRDSLVFWNKVGGLGQAWMTLFFARYVFELPWNAGRRGRGAFPALYLASAALSAYVLLNPDPNIVGKVVPYDYWFVVAPPVPPPVSLLPVILFFGLVGLWGFLSLLPGLRGPPAERGLARRLLAGLFLTAAASVSFGFAAWVLDMSLPFFAEASLVGFNATLGLAALKMPLRTEKR